MRVNRLLFFMAIQLLGLGQVLHAQQLDQGKKWFEANNLIEAKKIFQGISSSSVDYHQAQYYLGRIHFNQKKYDDARSNFEKAIKIKNTVADYHYWLGATIGTLALDANVFSQGIMAPQIKSAFEKATELDPKHREAHWGLLNYYVQAPSFMGGSFEKAKETALAIQKISKAEGHVAMASILLKEKNNAGAEKEYESAAKADPAYRMQLATYYQSQAQYDKAFPLYEAVLKDNPDDQNTLYQLGKTSALSGKQLARGEEALLKFLKLPEKANLPSPSAAYMRLGQIAEKQKAIEQARKHYEKSLKLDPNMNESAKGLERIGK